MEGPSHLKSQGKKEPSSTKGVAGVKKKGTNSVDVGSVNETRGVEVRGGGVISHTLLQRARHLAMKENREEDEDEG